MVCIENRSSGYACILFKTGSSKKVAIQHSYVCRMIIKAKIHIFVFSHIINYWQGEGALGRPEQQLPVRSSRTIWPFVNFLAVYSLSSPNPARCSPCQASSVRLLLRP